MSGALVMISPSRREVSPVEQLYRSSRLVPPRGDGVSSRKVPSDFFLIERLHIGEDGRQRATRGATRYPREQGVGPLAFIFGEDFYLLILRCSVEFQDF